MADTTLTEEQVIRETYSASPPDPYADGVEEKYGNVIPWGDEVLMALKYPPEADYQWSPERAELLEDYVTEERSDELRGGADLTPDEEEAFREAAEREAQDAVWSTRTGYVFRVSAQPESGEHRAAFFTWTGVVGGQYMDTHCCGGPFHDIVDAVRFGDECEGAPEDWTVERDFPERPRFDAWLAARDGEHTHLA